MRRSWFVAAVVIGVLAIVIAAVAMRLSEGGSAMAQEWADEVCSSLSDVPGLQATLGKASSCRSLKAES